MNSIDSENCIFCAIVSGKAKGEILYQDELITAFRDIYPVAPIHILIVPNKHIVSVENLTTEDESLIGKMVLVAKKLAKSEGINESGYRLVTNTGYEGGQRVFHLHLHLIGGKKLAMVIG
ncbi:MAG TPA: histidine triad nucleotide-binding protein [Anaerolineales bacterium]|nr:histidine triad nucleotide-binding protein [Anaerolineales bacterium]